MGVLLENPNKHNDLIMSPLSPPCMSHKKLPANMSSKSFFDEVLRADAFAVFFNIFHSGDWVNGGVSVGGSCTATAKSHSLSLTENVKGLEVIRDISQVQKHPQKSRIQISTHQHTTETGLTRVLVCLPFGVLLYLRFQT